MNRHLTAATVVVATLAAVPTAAVAAPPPKAVACGALARTRVHAIEATVVRCAEARRMAKAHERSVARNGACAPRSTANCKIGRFHCVYPFGPTPPLRVTCAWRGDYKVTFAYRSKGS